jgi:superfamily I DNA/RNA helicase
MTAHKSKGLESKNVHIIEQQLFPSKYAKMAWQMQQEQNLMYVSYTRAKEVLSFVQDWKYKRKD